MEILHFFLHDRPLFGLIIYAHINMHDHILIGQLASFNQGKCQVMILICASDSETRARASTEIALSPRAKSQAVQSITNTVKLNKRKYIHEKPNNEAKYQKKKKFCRRNHVPRIMTGNTPHYDILGICDFCSLCLNSAPSHFRSCLLILSLHFLQMGRTNRLLGP